MARRLAGVLLALVLAVGSAWALAGCGGGVPREVKEFDSSGRQTSGNVTYINYQVIVSADVDWDALSDSRKQAIIDYAFEQAYAHSEESGRYNWNLVGVKEAGPDDGGQTVVLFIYDREHEQVVLYSAGEQAETRWPAPKPPR